MNEIELIMPTKAHEADAKAYLQAHFDYGEPGLHGSGGLDDAKSYDEWLDRLDRMLTADIRSHTFFAIRQSDQKLIGTINIRYPYEGYVQRYGHIGYGIHPDARRQGYATMMLGQALGFCKQAGLEKVLLVCDKENPASAKTIIKCGGVLDREALMDDGEMEQRYWIAL